VQDISERKRAIEAIHAEQGLLKLLYESQENERRLVAFELHDGPIQYVTAALMHLEAFAGNSMPATPELELARNLLKKTLKESRRLMNGIRPPVLDEAGLEPAINQVIQEGGRLQPHVEFDCDPALGRFAPSLESAIYRIAQEGLTNARTHSHSDRVRISLRKCDDQVKLEIQDWGIGFDQKQLMKQRGGLKGFAERVRLAGGKLEIQSSPGNGTILRVALPLLLAV
jgi:signal transduction histidine kinase